MRLFYFYAAGLLALCSLKSRAQSAVHMTGNTALQHRLHGIADTSTAHIGFAVLGIDFSDSLYINGQDAFPMQSVFKFPLSMYIMHKIDLGELARNQKIHLPAATIDDDTWSPMADKWPNQDIDISLADLITYTVSQSDNNGCDALFRLAGGTRVVNNYMHSIGIQGINIRATEHQMHQRWRTQYTNWCEPAAMAHLLGEFYNGKRHSAISYDFLMDKMIHSVNNNRIKGLLPASAIVAHKTGTSGTNANGLTAATNDVGIITLPDGRHIAVVAFISNYHGGVRHGEAIIAQLSKVVWDYYTEQ